MKNLKLYSEVSLLLHLQSDDESILFSAIDIERNRLFFASSGRFVYTARLSSFEEDEVWKESVLPAEVSSVELEPGDSIMSFDYLMEKESLVVGTSNGVILLHNVDTNDSEIIGRVDGGVSCISLCPDGDSLGVITGYGQLLLMTHDWDLLQENSVDEVPEGNDLNAGDEKFSSRNVLESRISWRGDGRYLATLCKFEESDSYPKKLKFWERDSGSLHASSQSKAFMGTLLDWMPSGAKLAAVYPRVKESESPSVVFYERNGLERSSFCVNSQGDIVIDDLKWNCSSDLLAILVKSGDCDQVQIWYCCNNHWYLKQEFCYLKHDGVKFMWHPTKPLQLLCWTHGGRCMIYHLCWKTAVTDNSIALVIDGSRVLVTPLFKSLLPPPMYLFSLNFSSAVRDFSLYSKNSRNTLAVALANGFLGIVELPESGYWEELDGKEYRIEPSLSKMSFQSLIHLAWLDSLTLAVISGNHTNLGNTPQMLAENDEPCGYHFREMEIICHEDRLSSSPTISGWQARVTNLVTLRRPVIGITLNPAKQSSALIQFDGGNIFEYTSISANHGGVFKRSDNHVFSSSCLWMNAVSLGGQAMLFGLDEVGRLQVDGKILCSNCCSYSFYSNLEDEIITHLIVATKQDLLFIIDICEVKSKEFDFNLGSTPIFGKKRREEESGKFVHIWERGAKIVGVLHGDDAAVLLQATRGNLECVYPRKLVLASIINALVQHRFKDALLMVRRHRIDFNIIVDHCGWHNFLSSAPEFVKQVENISYLTEFVCAIKKENIVDTLYKNYVASSAISGTHNEDAGVKKASEPSTKVSSVLKAIRKAIEEQLPESPYRELCILTTLARSEPPALEEALGRIKLIRGLELSGSNDVRGASLPSAEEALKHLLWLSDSEAVFESALGLYDLHLAAMVALNSQKDPKEFLPFLQELQRLPLLLMQYNIDLKLHRYEKALKHIASAGDSHYDDFMNLLKNNPQLFPLGLQLTADPGKRHQVLEAWGDHLSEIKDFEEAAATYLCCQSLEKALKAYRSNGSWSGMLTVAGQMRLGKDEVVRLAHEVCEELQALGKPGEAAKVALDYCKDVKAGVSLLVRAREWEEALRTALMHDGADLYSEVKDASVECADTMISEYEEGLEKVGKYVARYLAVRQRRLLLAAKLQSEEQKMSDVDDDTASETSSNFSGMSAYTRGKGSAASVSTSAGSRARESRRQRNRGKIRAGSPDEELALVEHLKGMSLTAGAIREIRSLLACLLMLGKEEPAKKLQRTVENFQLCQAATVKLVEDTFSTSIIDEQEQTLDRYSQKTRPEMENCNAFSWRYKAFISPRS
ncbi:hypothetical protein MLD38_011178 [Melastoma candidum]|uniref:Uncharacterized protein n=1 Tax=Melastoma candidum TaxID=119954 RepID=A0ACB9R1P9_9MYRT|nr:hypothetical protein MLD38_011178 [Melastoma candidum]